MISEVLLLMITCILIPLSSTEVKWTVRDTSPTLGQGLTLFCKVVNCTVNGTKRWRGGPDDKVLMLNSGISIDKAKYSTLIEKNGFILTILNLTVEYLNVSYDCSCGLDNDKHILYIDVYTDMITDPNTEEGSTISTSEKEDLSTDMITDPNTEEGSTISTSEKEDLSTVDNLNKTTNGTNYVGTNDARGIHLYVPISIAIILAIVLIIVIVVIQKYGLWERLKEKICGTRRKNPDADDDQNMTDLLLQNPRIDSNPRQSSDHRKQQFYHDSELPAGFPSIEEKIDADARSIYVGNVDYGATAEELEQHFHGCGSVNRVTILCDKFTGHPKGFAYVEFADKDSVTTAQALDDSLFRGRQIKVTAKRTNRPGISSTNRRPRGGRGGYGGFRGSSPGGYYTPSRPRGRFGRFRRATYYSPY